MRYEQLNAMKWNYSSKQPRPVLELLDLEALAYDGWSMQTTTTLLAFGSMYTIRGNPKRTGSEIRARIALDRRWTNAMIVFADHPNNAEKSLFLGLIPLSSQFI